MRTGGSRKDVRASALWGSGKRGTGSRGNALWGSGKRRTAVLAALALTLTVPLGASAVPGPKSGRAQEAFVSPGLLIAARSHGGETFPVIVQGKAGNQPAHAVASVLGLAKKDFRSLRSIDGVSAELTGDQILALSAQKHITAITLDARVRLSAAPATRSGPTSPA